MDPSVIRASVADLVGAVSASLGLVHPRLLDHQQRVAVIADAIGVALGWTDARLAPLCMAALLHDVGSVSITRRLRLPDDDHEDRDHAAIGAAVVGLLPQVGDLVLPIRYHHVDWAHGAGARSGTRSIPLEAHVLHLADHVDGASHAGSGAPGARARLLQEIADDRGQRFNPAVVAAFLRAAGEDGLSAAMATAFSGSPAAQRLTADRRTLDIAEFEEFASVLGLLVDLRSSDRPVHSAAVAAVSEQIALTIGLSHDHAREVKIVGLLHNLGKLAVPQSITDSDSALTEVERQGIAQHPLHTDTVLGRVRGIGAIGCWASLHHELLDGSGYPWGLAGEAIPLEARIVAVADRFVAMQEDRAHRRAWTPEAAVAHLLADVTDGRLDEEVVGTVVETFGSLGAVRIAARAAEQGLARILADLDAHRTAERVTA